MATFLCFIREQFFKEHTDFKKMLDPGNASKQSRRTHICIKVSVDENTFYIPLRNNMGAEIRPFGRIGHSVPSQKRPNAGLDFRYALIINDTSYIEMQTERRIPMSQYHKIAEEYSVITQEFQVYLSGYKRAAKKRRVEREPLYRESCLINFHRELGINC